MLFVCHAVTFFAIRVVNDWNGLPNDLVNVNSMNLFKTRFIIISNMILYRFFCSSSLICVDQAYCTPNNNNNTQRLRPGLYSNCFVQFRYTAALQTRH